MVSCDRFVTARDCLQMIRDDRGVSTSYIDTIYFIENYLSNGPGKKVLTLLLSLLYFWYWLKQQILRNLRKATCILFLCFLTNFLKTKSWSSLSNTEIIFKDWHVKLLTFLGCFLQFLWLVEILTNISMWGKRIALQKIKRNCFPSYPDHYLVITGLAAVHSADP